MDIKKGNIYQLYELAKVSSNKEAARSVPTQVYVQVCSVDGNVAQVMVVYKLKQPKSMKLYNKQRIYVPISTLHEPDIFPAYSHRPLRWLQLVKAPLEESAMEVLQENYSHAIATPLKTTILGRVEEKDLKVGQVWGNQRYNIILEKEIDGDFIVSKLGEKKKLSKEEVLNLIKREDMLLRKNWDVKAVLKAVLTLLAPFVGVFMLKAIGVALEKYLVRKV